jgi:hypothetical protein
MSESAVIDEVGRAARNLPELHRQPTNEFDRECRKQAD